MRPSLVLMSPTFEPLCILLLFKVLSYSIDVLKLKIYSLNIVFNSISSGLRIVQCGYPGIDSQFHSQIVSSLSISGLYREKRSGTREQLCILIIHNNCSLLSEVTHKGDHQICAVRNSLIKRYRFYNYCDTSIAAVQTKFTNFVSCVVQLLS